MQAMFSLSLGATNPGPPSTCRGTIVNAAAAADDPTKSRRETVMSPRSGRKLLLVVRAKARRREATKGAPVADRGAPRAVRCRSPHKFLSSRLRAFAFNELN